MSVSHPRDLIGKDNELVFSLPTIYFELQAALNDPNKTFQDLGDIISFDPALSARLLKIVNSPFYGFPSKIDTISHATSIIGRDQLTDLALATLVIYQFRGIPNNLFNMEKFWRHSMACGVVARSIAEFRGEKNVERFYLAGILHDIGRLVGCLLPEQRNKGNYLFVRTRTDGIRSCRCRAGIVEGLATADASGGGGGLSPSTSNR
jgi:HD-like signal output (HDOD) protein